MQAGVLRFTSRREGLEYTPGTNQPRQRTYPRPAGAPDRRPARFSRCVTRQEADGSITVIANSFRGSRLNCPNDVVVKSDGCIYFTDPWTSPSAPQQWDLHVSGVYREPSDEDVYISACRYVAVSSSPATASPGRCARRAAPSAILSAGFHRHDQRVIRSTQPSTASATTSCRFSTRPSERLALGSKDQTLEAIEWMTPGSGRARAS